MYAAADVIVSSPDSTESLMIVEVKSSDRAHETAEAQFKENMLQLSCPVGLIVTAEKMSVYLDRFTSRKPDSIERIGEFGTGHLCNSGLAREMPSKMPCNIGWKIFHRQPHPNV